MSNVIADVKLCQGYANCVLEAPEHFDLDEDGVVVLLKETFEEAERDRIEQAVDACPVRALMVVVDQ